MSELTSIVLAFTETFLKEGQRRVRLQEKFVVLGHALRYQSGIASRIYQFLFVIEELALEARVGKDHTAFRLDVPHSLEQCPIVLMHQVGDHARRRPGLSCVTVPKITLC